LIVTPGPDTALTIRNTMAGGRAAGLGTALGVASGQAIWTLAAAVRPGDREPAQESTAPCPRSRLAARTAMRQGLINDLANPKMAVFYTSLLPQFAPSAGPAFPVLIGLGVLFSAMTLRWLALYITAVDRLGELLRRTGVRRAIDAVMGIVLAALGGRLALERR